MLRKNAGTIAFTATVMLAGLSLNPANTLRSQFKESPQSNPLVAQAATVKAGSGKPHGGMNPNEFVPMKVKAIDGYNYNTRVYHFELESPDATVDAPLTSYVLARYNDGEKDIVRPYTPIHTHEKGQLSLLVKSYPTGKMSKHFAELKPGDVLDIKGPCQKLKYEPNRNSDAVMICGGTGITPMLQLAEGILRNPEDKTKIKLIFANATQEDILLKPELDALAKTYPDRFQVVYSLDKPPAGWKGLSGYLNKDAIAQLLPKSKDTMVYVCGPPGMMNAISGPKGPNYTQGDVGGVLKDLGFDKDHVYKF